MFQTIDLKSSPDLKKVIRAAFPNYKKRKAFLSVFDPEYGVNVNSYWDGGSRELHSIVELASMRTKPLPTQSHPYFDLARHIAANQKNQDVSVDHAGNVTLKRLPEGFALVSAGAFCGKPSTAHVYLNAENLAKLLEAAKLKPKSAGTIKTTWEIRTYDVWGNSKDGWDVNNVFSEGEIELWIPQTRYNVGTPNEFLGAYPSKGQIRKVFGLGKTHIDLEGDDMYIAVNRSRDGYPIGELHCTSHESLSPVRRK